MLILHDRLHKMCIGYEAGTLDFKPTCSLELLKEQKAAMGQYLHCLEVRAQIEGLTLLEYIGTKMVKAVLEKRCWLADGNRIIHEFVAQEAISTATACEDGYKVLYPDGYASWSLKDALAFAGTHGLQVGWLASQADMLSDDWHMVE